MPDVPDGGPDAVLDFIRADLSVAAPAPGTPPISEDHRREAVGMLDVVEAHMALLHPIEQAIVTSIRKQPVDRWCAGCYRLIHALWQKVTRLTGEERIS